MWEDANYCWVVLCKNHWFHKNIFFRHKIPLGQTDAVTPLPPLSKYFAVRCDECRKIYTYQPKDVRKVELDLPESFKPHPLFREDAGEGLDTNRGTAQQVRQEERPKEEPPQKERLQGESRQEEPANKESPQEEKKRAKGAGCNWK